MTHHPRISTLLCAIALGACAQRDPDAFIEDTSVPGAPVSSAAGSGASDPMLDGEGDLSLTAGDVADSYYPLVDGARWTYRHTGGETEWDEEVTQTIVPFEGRPAVLLQDSPGPSGTRSASLLVRDEARISRVYRAELMGERPTNSVEYDPGFLRFDEAWPAEDIGFSASYDYRRIEYDASGRKKSSGDRTHTFTIEALSEAIRVPAGTFDDCVRIARTRLRPESEPAMEGDDELFWFCAGVGKVKEQDRTGGNTEELIACDVPGGRCP
jgi:hypothetical protein